MSPLLLVPGFVGVVAVGTAVFFAVRYSVAQTKILNEKRDWEMRRIATAFGIKETKLVTLLTGWHGEGLVEQFDVYWVVNEIWKGAIWELDCDYRLDRISIGVEGIEVLADTWIDYNKHTKVYEIAKIGQKTCDLMKRGLYCLGFEEDALFAQLNCTLTAHEQLELRLSLPREFWPQKWLEEG